MEDKKFRFNYEGKEYVAVFKKEITEFYTLQGRGQVQEKLCVAIIITYNDEKIWAGFAGTGNTEINYKEEIVDSVKHIEHYWDTKSLNIEEINEIV